MPTLNRLTGRFFTVLISLSLAILVPRAAFAGGGTKKALSPTLCQISDTVYRADGSPAQGTVLLSWQAFTTAAGQAVSPGSLLVTLDANGGFNASVAPNTGASPAGTYYKAIFKLSDGTTETEFWVVPNAQTTTIGAIRSKLVPSQQAAQFLTRDFADSNYVSLASTQSITGVKTFSASPAVPTPQNPTDAANKSYVDANSGSGNLASPPPIGNVTPNAVSATDLKTLYYPSVEVRSYGAVGDGKIIGGGCSITGGTATLTCPSGTFASNDTGKTVTISEAGTATGCTAGHPNGKCPFKATILSFTDSAHVTLTAKAISSVSGSQILFGTNNLAAFQAAIDFASNTNTSEFEIYIPHALGQGTNISVPNPGCYLVDGTIKLPDSSQSQFKWVRMRGDGNTASALCEADWTKDLILATYPGGAGTEYWFKDFGLYGSNNFYNPSAIHCVHCPAARFEGLWFSGFQNAILADVDGSGNGTQLLKIWGNTFELSYSALKWVRATNGPGINISNFLDMHDNMIDIGSFNWAVDKNGNPLYPYSIDLNEVFAAKIYSNFFWGVGRGIRCIDCPDLDVYDNDFTFMSNSLLGGEGGDPGHYYGYQNLSLSGTSSGGYSRRQNIHGNHFSSSNSEAVDVVGATIAQFSGNVYTYNGCCSTGEPYMSITATNGANTIGINNEWIDASASPAISVASGALSAGSVISGNYFASGVTTPISVAGSLPSGVYVAMNSGDVAGGNGAFAGSLTYQGVPGVHYLVSHYGSIQAAINAAYNNGAVLGTVIDDRTAPYNGPGFILYDSVTLKLAATSYTITSTVTYNNGNNNVTAGIVSLAGARLIGASTSSNHGTIITAGNGLNADLIATSSVGTGVGSTAQWWHWGGFENLRVTGNGANQTAGNCFNIENMGETAFLRTIEVSGCYLDNILFTGASATPSDIANITTNGAGRYGFNFNNLAGMAVVHGLSGDSNTTSIVRLNGGQSGTLTILGFKTEEEISGQDPLITIDETGQNGAQPALFIVGGYTFGRSGVNDVIKYVNGTMGTTPYISVSNFYVQNYVNAVNDTVNNRTTAAVNMNKVPFYFGPTGAFFSGQAFTLDLNTFVQSPHSGNYVLTEVFGTTSSNETLVGGSGTSTSLTTGGIGFRMPNRNTYGQTPDLFAKMTYAFPGGVPNTQQWEFIPVKVNGDNSTRWIGDPSYRWDEVYSADMNSTTATVGTLNVTTCNGCGGSFQQVNSDWNASSGVAQILNKPTIPAPQVNSDWNASSGMAQIMNKPALATVATSGNYNDLSNKPSIPAPQVNSDWNASSGVAQILNKPALATVATSGNYNDLSNKPAIPVQGAHLVSGTMQGNTATLTGNSADQTIFTATLPAGTFTVGTGAHCWAKWQHTTSGSTAITYKWTLGAATAPYASFTSASVNANSDIEILTPSSLTSQILNESPLLAGTSFQAGATYGAAGSENLANADTIKFTFNAGSGEQVKGVSFYCQTVQ